LEGVVWSHVAEAYEEGNQAPVSWVAKQLVTSQDGLISV
jgi:hypothetical protein